MAFLLWMCFITGSLLAGSQSQNVCVVPKCCAPNQSIDITGKGCSDSSLKFEPDFWNEDEITPQNQSSLQSETLHLIVGDPCKFGKYRLEPKEDSSDEFHILCNGSLFVPFHSENLYEINNYCLESFVSDDDLQGVTLPLLCFPPPPKPPTVFEKVAMAVYPVGLLISVPFLLLTVFVFSGVPELRNTQGKSLCCHCSSLAVAYLSLATTMLTGNSLPQAICITFAFIIQLSFVSCFFWLNVLCIDTWWRLTRKPCWSSHQERVRFLWYSVYAWSVPLIFVIVTMVMQLTPIVPDAYIKPNFGVQSCWFHSREAAFPFFYAPIGLLLLVNIWLFVLSVSSVRLAVEQRIEEELGLNTDEEPCAYSKAGRRIEMFKQSLILFVVMGLNWTLELLSYFVGGSIEAWILTDTLNSLQGVIIYFIFIVRVPRVKHLASARLASLPGLTSLCGQG